MVHSNLTDARLLRQGVPTPAEGDYAVAEIAGHLVHAASSHDQRLLDVAQNARVYNTVPLETGRIDPQVAARCLQGSDLPPPQKRTKWAPQKSGFPGHAAVTARVTELVSNLGRVPGLGSVIYGLLQVPPTMNVPGEQPPPAKRRRGNTGNVFAAAEAEVAAAAAAEDAQHRSWEASHQSASPEAALTVCATAWDKCSPTLAVAVTGAIVEGDKDGLSQGSVLLYDADKACFTAVLRSPKQKGIACMQFSALPGVLAVGCAFGVVLWDTANTCQAVARGAVVAAALTPDVPEERKLGVFASYEELKSDVRTARLPPSVFFPHNGPVTTLCFSNLTGRYMAYGGTTAAAFAVADLSLNLEDAGTRKGQLVWTDAYGGARQLSFSPDDRLLLFTTSHRPLMALYDTQTWAKPREVHFSSPVCSPQWHPENFLFFHLQNAANIVCLKLWDDKTPGVLPFSSLKPKMVLCEHLETYARERGDSTPADGVVRTLALDPTGHRLAVVLYDGHVAVYGVDSAGERGSCGQLSLHPIGLARMRAPAPPAACMPVRLAFSHFVASGALLSAAWGDGLLTFLPLRYSKDAGRQLGAGRPAAPVPSTGLFSS
eukprot:Rhum_TRINITY_DN4482_c0_g1::Rhum_TRINITY_DN4482_c0_g1_i1::g.14538::m.14538/K14320/AAAS; aladin